MIRHARWSDVLANSALTVLAVCAATATAVIVSRELRRNEPQYGIQFSSVRDWRSYADGGHWNGPRDAPVVIVEFADFQCPFCRTFELTLASIREKHGQNVAVVYRHYPLASIHALARPAAIASECASREGLFAQYRRVLYEHQASLAHDTWTKLASAIGIPDTSQFSHLRRAGSHGERSGRGRARGQATRSARHADDSVE